MKRYLDDFAKKKYIDKMKSQSKVVELPEWKPCHYYHQKWIAVKSTHTIYNYKYFLSDLFYSGNCNGENCSCLMRHIQ